jgi:hypothetical protein
MIIGWSFGVGINQSPRGLVYCEDRFTTVLVPAADRTGR